MKNILFFKNVTSESMRRTDCNVHSISLKRKTQTAQRNKIQLTIHNFLHFNCFSVGLVITFAWKETPLFFQKSVLFYLTGKTVMLSVLPEAECL